VDRESPNERRFAARIGCASSLYARYIASAEIPSCSIAAIIYREQREREREREQPAITPLAETNRPSIASKSPVHVRYFTLRALRPRRARRGLFNVGRCNVNAERYVATCSSQAQWSPPSSARLLKYGEGVILGKLVNSRGAYPPSHALTNDSVAGNAGDARENHQPRA